MKCFLLWVDEKLPALTDGINRAVHCMTNGLRTLVDLVIIASLQQRDIQVSLCQHRTRECCEHSVQQECTEMQ